MPRNRAALLLLTEDQLLRAQVRFNDQLRTILRAEVPKEADTEANMLFIMGVPIRLINDFKRAKTYVNESSANRFREN